MAPPGKPEMGANTAWRSRQARFVQGSAWRPPASRKWVPTTLHGDPGKPDSSRVPRGDPRLIQPGPTKSAGSLGQSPLLAAIIRARRSNSKHDFLRLRRPGSTATGASRNWVPTRRGDRGKPDSSRVPRGAPRLIQPGPTKSAGSLGQDPLLAAIIRARRSNSKHDFLRLRRPGSTATGASRNWVPTRRGDRGKPEMGANKAWRPRLAGFVQGSAWRPPVDSTGADEVGWKSRARPSSGSDHPGPAFKLQTRLLAAPPPR
ncbi:hypothetical protein Pan216_23010 [Planctomycetes bacterium Pan216]|uniref:Uncharacterized protein n=1 Tax=Kolteria novifilia TaxID=2527975 RepID=A0A518B3C5_9BACT|nr:hypothetical protein Pan216_23010 [Planctomycetes bacterium Pan216]